MRSIISITVHKANRPPAKRPAARGRIQIQIQIQIQIRIQIQIQIQIRIQIQIQIQIQSRQTLTRSQPCDVIRLIAASWRSDDTAGGLVPLQVLCGRGSLVLSQPAGRRALAALRIGRTRTFSAASSDEPYITVSHADSGPRTVWPDENMGPFGPQDQRFQLPGNVGFDCHLEGMADQKKAPVHRTVPDVLTAPSSSERHQFILAQFVSEFQQFVSGAKEMCFALWTAGYWADFIDPTTGAAFFASPSQTALRTEEELENLGFHIEVSGSCTVIRHILRGTPLFVGTVFTNAPTHSAAIARLQGLSNILEDEE
ncbi:hypothetical protein F2P81_002724 [Scophthalmus maximus]|uniref:Uncharacterized protein n=1 Tax=Scophthalmus maximus TaxID=52904 RepID=A0A6A4TLP5_SCOMX|nr:hypothetical protein F2P81_002724 [Scophthalmus maximus]